MSFIKGTFSGLFSEMPLKAAVGQSCLLCIGRVESLWDKELLNSWSCLTPFSGGQQASNESLEAFWMLKD